MKFDSKQLKEMSDAARSGAIYAIRNANSGHVGIALGAADILTTIYANHLRRDVDKFVLSAGHGSALLYSVLKLSGYNIQSLQTFRKFGGLPGHPEYGIDGVAATTGPLGQGIGNAVGMALAEKINRARGGRKSDGIVYCLCSDGDLMEGVANESIAFAGLYKLDNLVLLWDDNKISIDGTALTDIDMPARMQAAGFAVFTINGNNFKALDTVLAQAKKINAPVFIQCQTVLGAGMSVAGTPAAHGLSIGVLELTRLEEKFTSANGLKLWDLVAKSAKISSLMPEQNESKLPNNFCVDVGDISSRELSARYLEKLIWDNNHLLGGSADLGGSTSTKVPGHRDIMPGDFSGNFINYGVREHAMGAIMNGLCSAGFRPYGGTFLAFSDYMRPAIRLSALSRLPVIYVLTHDSIAVGEDGPTHQPVEQLASLRLIPNLNIFRPCNAAEVAASWGMALSETARPSCIILSRQKFEQISTPSNADISCGGYIIKSNGAKIPKVTLIATGSEVPLAIAVAKKLGNTAVVSMLSVEKFRVQSEDYKKKILRGYVVSIEAGATSGWFEFADAVMGIDEFGASGSGDEVYDRFGFNVDKIACEIKHRIK